MTTFAADKFAEALRTQRGTRDLRTAAEEIGLSATQLMRLEKAESTPGIDTFLLLCDWLGMRPATFLEDDRLTIHLTFPDRPRPFAGDPDEVVQ